MPALLDELAPFIAPFLEQELVVELGEPIKSGKEATVFRCRAHPRTGYDQLALKVYRPRTHRSFKRDASYRDGSAILRRGEGNTRHARALRAGSTFGRELGSATWCGHEWEVLCRLHAAGVPVPKPVHLVGGAFLMELFTRVDGRVASPLASAMLDASSARRLFDALCRDVEDMLALHVVHADLSAYNVMWNGEQYRIIDLPQSVDPRFNGEAERLLTRDLENVASACARAGGEVPDAVAIARDMWRRYQNGEV